jgi:hypothetical protein
MPDPNDKSADEQSTSSDEQPTSFSEKLTAVLIKLVVSGSGVYALYSLYTKDLPTAAISAIVTLGGGLLTSFGEGLVKPLKAGLTHKGARLGQALDRRLDTAVDRAGVNLTDFKKKYQEALKVYCHKLEVEGFEGLPGLALEDVFVPLRVDADTGLRLGGSQPIWHFLPRLSVTDQPVAHRRIVVLAGAGYGKTTLMRHLTLSFVNENYKQQGVPYFLPVLLRFREIHTLILEDSPLNLSQLIAKALQNQPEFSHLDPSSNWFHDQLDAGKCLVLLDGLDEVPKSQRPKVRRWADREMRRYGKTRFILTSRPTGYKQQPNETPVPVEVETVLNVLDFTPDQKQAFVDKWYGTLSRRKWDLLQRENERQAEVSGAAAQRLSGEQVAIKIAAETEERASDLMRQIVNTPALNDLARNPLLITMIATTHCNETALPKQRVELYDKMLNLLLGSRPAVRKTPLTLTATENRAVLQVLAWNLVDQEMTLFTPAQGEPWISPGLIRCRKDRSLTVKDFWAEIRDTAGVLQEGEYGKYEFAHQTFQEYLAALHLRELPSGAELLWAQLDNDRWAEVICFYAALGEADELIAKLLAAPTTSQRLKMAQRCKDEGRSVSPESRAAVDSAIAQSTADLAELDVKLLLQRRVSTLQPLGPDQWISPTAVTWAEYGAFLADQAAEQFHSTATIVPSPGALDQAVSGVGPGDARWFCAWLSTQLPTAEGLYRYRPATTAEQAQIRLSPDALSIVREQIPERYRQVLNYLANGRWKEADQETQCVMLAVAGQTEQGFLQPDDLEKFPCADLQILDQLWVQFSGGHFGFSVQKEIWVECGEPRPSGPAWDQFCAQVGWKGSANNYMNYSDLKFNHHISPWGEIPWVGHYLGGGVVGVWYLFARAKTCKV